jgi:hypothetical protein
VNRWQNLRHSRRCFERLAVAVFGSEENIFFDRAEEKKNVLRNIADGFFQLAAAHPFDIDSVDKNCSIVRLVKP